ncbi:(Fe-S)-binding protein [Micromonospora sp. NPDC050200]|uniref:(Fe-S)-binding protein n=1 Tax=Micromonospora sp. NPDC050200 TaxID=3155664 RepID=UPI0033CBE3D3
MRIALFITCVNDIAYPQTGIAVTRILERLGHTVDFPTAQTCCGQMHANTGYRAEALPMVHNYVEVFDRYDAIVTPSGSCTAMVRDQYPHLHPAAASVAARTYELSELLVDVLGVTDVGAEFAERVTYHPTCHGLRMLRLGDKPLALLRQVRGIQLVELGDPEECCGFGGTFALKNPDVSTAMLTDKCRRVLDTGASVLAAADNSCLAHIGGGLGRGRSGVRVMHYAEILASTGASA